MSTSNTTHRKANSTRTVIHMDGQKVACDRVANSTSFQDGYEYTTVQLLNGWCVRARRLANRPTRFFRFVRLLNAD